MKRIDFIKRIFGMAVASALPVSVSAKTESKKEILFNEIFYRPYNNERLLYLIPGCEVDIYLREKLQSQITDVPGDGVYLVLHNLLLPKKEKYSLSDFDYVIRAVQHCQRHNKLTNNMMRFFDEGSGLYLNLFVHYEQQF